MVIFMEITVDTLEQAFLADERSIARLRARQAAVLAELDRAQVQAIDGARTLAEWVAARLDAAPATAKHLVDAARLLTDQPDRAAELASGESSFDRVLATARLAAAGADDQQVARSRGFDIAGVQRMTAMHRRVTRHSEHADFGDRYLVFQPRLDRSAYSIHGQLPGEPATAAIARLGAHADTYPPLPNGQPVPQSARMADAFCDLLSQPRHGHDEPEPTVTIIADAALAAPTAGEAGAAITGGPRIGPETLHKILCGGTVEVTTRHSLATSPAARTVPPRLRRAVITRDLGTCAVGGCRSRYRLQVHHIHPQASGGTHHPTNLVTLCWFHHQVVVHGYGYTIDPNSPPNARRLIPPHHQRIPTRAPP